MLALYYLELHSKNKTLPKYFPSTPTGILFNCTIVLQSLKQQKSA
jgi:hypothetical protein